MKKLLLLRKYTQFVSFMISIILFVLFYKNILLVVHKLCPHASICFGTLSITSQTLIYPLTLLISILFTLLSMFWGRFFCGFLCFFGTAQEYIYTLFHKKCRPVVKINYIEEKKLGFLKYIVLILCIILSFLGLSYIYMNFCPVTTLAWINNITIYGIITLFVIFILSALIERFWCRFLCPYGALLNITQYLGRLLKINNHPINRNLETCIDCNICCKACPMNINLLESEIINNPNCIRCYRCVSKCPKKGTLNQKG